MQALSAFTDGHKTSGESSGMVKDTAENFLPSRLSELPSELQLQIGMHLEPDAASSLAETCSHWRGIMTSVGFRTVSLTSQALLQAFVVQLARSGSVKASVLSENGLILLESLKQGDDAQVRATSGCFFEPQREEWTPPIIAPSSVKTMVLSNYTTLLSPLYFEILGKTCTSIVKVRFKNITCYRDFLNLDALGFFPGVQPVYTWAQVHKGEKCWPTTCGLVSSITCTPGHTDVRTLFRPEFWSGSMKIIHDSGTCSTISLSVTYEAIMGDGGISIHEVSEVNEAWAQYYDGPGNEGPTLPPYPREPLLTLHTSKSSILQEHNSDLSTHTSNRVQHLRMKQLMTRNEYETLQQPVKRSSQTFSFPTSSTA